MKRAPLLFVLGAAVIVIGYFDYLTGFLPDLTVLYLVPIVLGSLYLGLAAAVGLALLSATINYASDFLVVGRGHTIDVIADGSFHLLIFIAIAYFTRRAADDYRVMVGLKNELANDMEIAKATQKAIFPQEKPRITGFDVGIKISFAKAVGGDFYDFLPVESSKYALVLADISGKSLSAALFTALLRENWRNALAGSHSPGAIVEDINRRLYKELPAEMFVTMFCGVLDGPTGEFLFVNAGHEPGLLFHAGRPGPLSSDRPMIVGTSETLGLEEKVAKLEPGSVLVLYSDGLIDPPSAGYDFRSISLIVERHAREPAQQLADRLYEARFAGPAEKPIDDITIICIKRKA